jgi:hypothetical protein
MASVHPLFDLGTRTWYTECGHEARSLAELRHKLPSRTVIVGYYPRGFTAPPWPPSQVMRCALPVKPVQRNSKTMAIRAMRHEQRVAAEAAARRAAQAPAANKVAAAVPPPPPPPPRKPGTRGLAPKFNREYIMDLVAAGLSRAVVAARMGCSVNLVSEVVTRFTKAGDPRCAVVPVRYHKPVHVPPGVRSEVEASRTAMAATGLTAVGKLRWSHEAADQLVRLMNEGYTGTQLAALHGTTRNTILGVVHRRRLQVKLEASRHASA